VALRRGRPLELVVDGQERTVWVTALDVDEALAQLDLRESGLFVSASRSRSIPLDGLSLEVRTPKQLVIAVDGVEVPAQLGRPDGRRRPRRGEHRARPPGPRDAGAERGGHRGPARRGQPGVQQQGDHRGRHPVRHRAPRRRHPHQGHHQGAAGRHDRAGAPHRRDRRRRRHGREQGRRRRAAPARAGEPGPRRRHQAGAEARGRRPAPAGGSGPRQSTGGADSLNWGALAQCESGGNPRIVSSNGLYHGLYQFSTSTWRSVGGSGTASQASPDEQTYRAKLLYNRSGAGQWPTCGRRLFG
jgi:hypothetical protein